MPITCQFDLSKVAPSTKRHNFACNKFEIIKPNYVLIMHFEKKLQDKLIWKISEKELFINVVLFEANKFFRLI